MNEENTKPHTLEEDFQHFLAYSNALPPDERLRMAYEHGNDRGKQEAYSATIKPNA